MAAQDDLQSMRRGMYQTRRDDANRNVNAAAQENQDVIRRRMASIGQSGGGAAIGLEMKAKEAGENMRRQAMNDVNAQESADTIQSLEAQAGRDFAANEAGLGRGFQEKMALGDQTFKRGMFDTEQTNKLRELDNWDKQFALDRDTTDFNKRMAEIEAGRKPPGMLDGLGIPGLSNPMDIVKKQVMPGGLPNPVSAILPGVGGGGGK